MIDRPTFRPSRRGYDPEEVDAFIESLNRTTQAAKKQPLWDDMMDGLRAVMEPEVLRLAAMTPEIDIARWPNFAHLAADALTA